MTWLEQLNTLQMKLVDASPIDVNNDLFNAVNLFHDAHNEVAQRATNSLHISPYWAEAGRLMRAQLGACRCGFAASIGGPVGW